MSKNKEISDLKKIIKIQEKIINLKWFINYSFII